MIHGLTRAFPLWALAACALAWWQPEPLAALRPAILPLLGLVMFGMGMTLRPDNFREALSRPGVILLGLGLQFLLMPLAGWGLGSLLGLSAPLVAGMVLVGSAPGGTASNVICYLARGDVALSITLTGLSTLLAVVATPLLTERYLGRSLPVPAGPMLLTILEVVLLPVLAGMWLNHRFHARLAPVRHLFPLLSVLAIAVIIAVIVALNRGRLAELAGLLVVAVCLHNLAGLVLGYAAARLAGQPLRVARTLAIEVGMQNSGLAVALALKHFVPLAALPGALFSIWHNLSGSLLAGWWARRASDAS